MNAYCSYQGFDKLAQGVILDRGDHSELMRYMECHGFDALHQRQLRKRGNAEEINLHIRKHGWADELLEEMFDGLGKEIRKVCGNIILIFLCGSFRSNISIGC